MIHNIFTIQDSIAQAFLPPFFLPNSKMAECAFLDCIEDPNHQFAKHPLHYTLYKLGTWDDNNAEVNILDTPLFLVNGSEYATEPTQSEDPAITYLEAKS